MARIRTIKPDFFLNDELAELPALDRILFIGLWTQADREGRLSDRPRKIKAAILPYDEYDIEESLNRLQSKSFILRYQVKEEKFIQIINFLRHQYPNVKESVSTIPAPCQNHASTPRLRKGTIKGKERNNGDGAPAELPLNEKPFELPEWIPIETWLAFQVVRKKKRAACTDYAHNLILAELIRLKDVGQDPIAILDKSIKSGWSDVYPLKEEKKGGYFDS